MVAKLRYVPPETRDDNIAKMAEWLLQHHRAVVRGTVRASLLQTAVFS